MQRLLKKDSDLNNEHSTAACVGGYPSWWTSSESKFQQSPVSNYLSLKFPAPPQHCQNSRQLSYQFLDQESSSTQSTGQSYPAVANVGENNQYGPSLISNQLDYPKPQVKAGEGQVKSSFSMGTQNYVTPSQVDCRQSLTRPMLSYSDIYYGDFQPACGQQALIHYPQSMGLACSRVALPLDLSHNEPIFVNPKQYRAILRRRQYRAKLEAQSRLSKAHRKPYLHESRHLHALRRARGSGGRFLNTKKLQESITSIMTDALDSPGSDQTHLDTRISESVVHKQGNYEKGATTTSCSDITSASNSDSIFRYNFPVGEHVQSNGRSLSGGNQHYLSVIR